MTVSTTTVWTSSLAPDQLFPSREAAEAYEQKVAPRKLVAAIIDDHGSSGCVCADYDDAIDKIVAALGELWNVQGFVKPRIG